MGANKKISELTAGSAIAGTEELPIVQSSSTVKTTINAIKTYFDTIYATISGYVKKGTLTTNYIPKATASDTIGNSQVFDNGTNVGINTASPSDLLHVYSTSDKAVRIDTNSVSSYTGKKLAIEVGGGQWGVGFSSAENALTFLTTGSANGNFIFGYGTESSPISKFYYSSTFGGFAVNVALGSINAAGHFKAGGVWSPTDNVLLAETSSGSALFKVLNNGTININGLTASQIVETDASKNLVSAAKGTAYNKNFGTTAGTVLEGNAITQVITNGVTDKAPSEDAVYDALAAKKDTVSMFFIPTSFNPADSTTYYFSRTTPSTTDTAHKFNFPFNGSVIGAVFMIANNSVAGTTESSTINFRNITQGTSTLITNNLKTNAGANTTINTTASGVSIPFLSTDEVCLEIVTPVWVTNPTGVSIITNLFIEKTS